ncbi:hypothetical protein SIN8267_00447 [Sinobacterium norvegicum]|uniref:DUF58 domain-containing protein n=1 Tax=Sinobacterium norvegicum TaxID=1641715 RepID=A0ABM9ABK3_9GAMM|nr:DUF58 domain-containing protein [Sinobacterium norvegicum]CAH0990355.1 hypothetical protein SIN8267_00447 [Sinobacterium norvegicum]
MNIYQRWFQRWVQRRIPASTSVELNQKQLFIFVSGLGGIYIVVVFCLYLMANNFVNNSVFILFFWLLAIIHVTIFHTYRNLSGLRITLHAIEGNFSGDLVEIELMVIGRPGTKHSDLKIQWPGQPLTRFDVEPDVDARVKINLPAGHRGVLNPGRFKIFSHFPLSVFQCWSWLDLEIKIPVYPRPNAVDTLPFSGQSDEGYNHKTQGQEELVNLRSYRQGDSLKHVLWKTLAKQQPLQSIEFDEPEGRPLWLDYDELIDEGTEKNLATLSYAILQLSLTTNNYGLRLPGVEIQPNSGEQHKQQLLTALALFRGREYGLE